MAKELDRTENGAMEFFSRPKDIVLDIAPKKLLEAAERSQIHTFGWPIAVVMTRDKYRPRPYEEGIRAVIDAQSHYDYWTLKKNGEFYYIGTLFEDTRRENSIFLDTRIVRITETLLRIGGLYRLLGLDENEIIEIVIKHIGLKNRRLSVASPRRMDIWDDHICNVPEVQTKMSESIKNLDSRESLKQLVLKATNEITQMCDYFETKPEIVDPTVDAFLEGRIL